MKLTNETLKRLYLDDLKTMTPYGQKARGIQHYLAIPQEQTSIVNPLTQNIFLWSDQHFGHTNIIKYTKRPFPNAHLMNRCLVGNYQKVINDTDIVIFGGDIAFLKDEEANAILAELPGYKILIYGNHDMKKDGKPKDFNFDEKHLCLVLDVVHPDAEYQLLFTHYPLEAHNIPDGCYNIHGHIHEKTIPGSKHINISVECTNYAPIPLKNILEQTYKHQTCKSFGLIIDG